MLVCVNLVLVTWYARDSPYKFHPDFIDLGRMRTVDFISSLFMVALGLCFCAQAFSSCSRRGLFFVDFSDFSCGAWALGTRAAVVTAGLVMSLSAEA